ncbi:hypothetical protein NDU88_006155 [Pleurodeles waltl]|uniref:Uncharacterized protein n=1 Tax=Pleurodeles waltl TaxID=8319 RepID=A0AAV7SNV1_PLEWA|nr:hypothetical protein NDU88_006155 [Pleurodeles waltl]
MRIGPLCQPGLVAVGRKSATAGLTKKAARRHKIVVKGGSNETVVKECRGELDQEVRRVVVWGTPKPLRDREYSPVIPGNIGGIKLAA